MPHPALQHQDHRPWPLPERSWVLTMQWTDLAFLHWPVATSALQRLLPAGVEVETYDGSAWLGIVPFCMRRTRIRGLPPLPTAHEFPELNVRTYVRCAGKSGVWFFSLDAASRLAVEGARATFSLPYFRAEMAIEQRGQLVSYTSKRIDPRGPSAHFAAGYCPGGNSRPAAPGSLEHFLVERYCLFAPARGGGVRCGEIAHAKWQLQPASVQLGVCDMTRLLGISLPDVAPFALCAEPVEVAAWAPVRC
ncbi:MAG: DUF2071 domain-containing protein [Planctomycetota bacterium]